MKFEVAYFRPTKFGDPTREQAEDVYKKIRGRRRSQLSRSTAPFRIISSAFWCARVDDCTCRFTSTRRWASAIISTCPRATS